MDSKILNKIKSLDSLADVMESQKKKGKRIVHCHGVFDLVHLGHIRHFGLAKKEGDILVVTITADKYVKRGPGRPVFNEELRAEALASLTMTDYVGIVNDPTAIECIKKLKPHVYAKGHDYKQKEKDVTGKIYDEEQAVKSVGGTLVFTDEITFSSSKLINDYFTTYPQSTVKYLKALGKRYSVDDVIERLNALKGMKALVIGDTIIDQYHYCTPLGKSSKEHLVVTKYQSQETFAGGTLATANNAASICGEVDLLTMIGKDDPFQGFINGHLSDNVNPVFFYSEDANSIVKSRYVDEGINRKLFEICYMKDDPIAKETESGILQYLKKHIKDYDLVIVSDFGHGLLTKKIISFICKNAKYLAVNVQTNSANIGFNLVTKYPHANCVCIDERELRYATHDKLGSVRTLSKKVYEELNCEHIIATRGPHGSVSYSKKEGYHEAPAFAYKVIDSIGAGDAFFSFVAPCFAAGMSQDLVSFVGNAVGSLAVQIVCNREPVDFVDLAKFITRLLK